MASLLVKVSRDLGQKLRRGEDVLNNPLGRILARYGARLAPSYAAEGEAAQYFQVERVADEWIGALRDDLADLSDVEAAYIKPSDELP